MPSVQSKACARRGEALASLAETSVLEVTSKARGSFETHVKVLRGGEVAKQGLARQQRARQGTVVALRDFLFNRPVRRKQLLAAGCVRTPLLSPVLAHAPPGAVHGLASLTC
jgi:hypothetical protein